MSDGSFPELNKVFQSIMPNFPFALKSACCVAYIFDLRSLFARASRQLLWAIDPVGLHKRVTSPLANVLKIGNEAEFDNELNTIRTDLRKLLMAYLPHVFYPWPH